MILTVLRTRTSFLEDWESILTHAQRAAWNEREHREGKHRETRVSLGRLASTFYFPNLAAHSSLGKLHSTEHDVGRRHGLFQNPAAVLEGYIGKIDPSQTGREKTRKYVDSSTEIFFHIRLNPCMHLKTWSTETWGSSCAWGGKTKTSFQNEHRTGTKHKHVRRKLQEHQTKRHVLFFLNLALLAAMDVNWKGRCTSLLHRGRSIILSFML
jgi:hypothetical protein